MPNVDTMFSGFSTMFTIVFVFVIGVFVFILVKHISQWNKNNNSPRLTVDATVVTKRLSVFHYHHGDVDDIGSSSTTYYVTFQVDSGDRIELHVSGSEYGMLVEGDRGKLSFQGTRYLGFVRA